MTLLYGILINAMTLILETILDWFQIVKQNTRDQFTLLTRIFSVLFFALLDHHWLGHNFWLACLLGFGIFFAGFPYTLNLLRGKKWDYLGDKKYDQMIKKKLPNQYALLTLKMVILVGTLILYMWHHLKNHI